MAEKHRITQIILLHPQNYTTITAQQTVSLFQTPNQRYELLTQCDQRRKIQQSLFPDFQNTDTDIAVLVLPSKQLLWLRNTILYDHVRLIYPTSQTKPLNNIRNILENKHLSS
jgi:hypothetical protein